MERSDPKAQLAALFPDPRGLTIVDVGCGDGGLARHLASLGAIAVGIETDREQLAKVRAVAAENAAFGVGRGEALPFADGVVDGIVYLNSFHHVPDFAMAPALTEAARVLAPGGLLVVFEPLAEGAYFECLRPLEDETAVRAAALAALRSAPETLRPAGETRYLRTMSFPDQDRFLSAAVAPAPARIPRLPAVRDELCRRFERLGRQGTEGVEFDQPMRMNVFRRA